MVSKVDEAGSCTTACAADAGKLRDAIARFEAIKVEGLCELSATLAFVARNSGAPERK